MAELPPPAADMVFLFEHPEDWLFGGRPGLVVEKVEPHCLHVRSYVNTGSIPLRFWTAQHVTLISCNGVHDDVAVLRSALASVEQERDQLKNALRAVVQSASPHPVEHPTMWSAWLVAERAMPELAGRRLPTSDTALEAKLILAADRAAVADEGEPRQ